MASVAPATMIGEGDAYGPPDRSAWMDVDWRAHQRWVRAAGKPVNLVDLGPTERPDGGGSGPGCLVFLHGLSGSWQNWLENLPDLAARHRVIALDLPGFGASPMGAERLSMPGYARMLAELMDELGLASAGLVGHSMGGFVALEMAEVFPERVASLVLVSPAGLDARAQRNDRLLGVLRRAERLLIAGGAMVATHADVVARRARLRRAMMYLAVRHPHRLPSALMAEQIRQGSGKPGFVAAIDALTDHDIEAGLQDIRCPALVYWGREDRLVPVDDAGRLCTLIPGARSIILEDTGHMAMLERPARFNADVEAFLAGNTVGEGPG